MINDAFKAALLALMSGTPQFPAYLAVGNGGDLDLAGDDTGARYAPVATETAMRAELGRFGLSYEISGTNVIYRAIVPPYSLIGEDINEFGLLDSDGNLLQHHIPAADETGRASAYTKTDAVRWQITITVTVGMS